MAEPKETQEPKTGDNESQQHLPDHDWPDYDWRDPSQPRNPEDNIIVNGWRRRADGTYEKVEPEK
jgi:hypothetical protein